jgi:hypothetical protein
VLLGQSEPCGEQLECIMASAAAPGNPVCPYTMGQIGLADKNENSVPDLYESYPTVEFLDLQGAVGDTVYSDNAVMAARAWNDPVMNRNSRQAEGSRNHYTPRLVRGVYRINSGFEIEMMPTDRVWDDSREDLGFVFSGLTPGVNTIAVTVENHVGLTATTSRQLYFVGIRFSRTYALVQADKIDLNWITAKEVFGARFEVIRDDLTAGTGWETLAVIDTCVSSGVDQNHYRYIDHTIEPGREYRYQVVATFELDIGGVTRNFVFNSQAIEKTAMIPVGVNLASNLLPNPTTGRTTFTVDIPESFRDPTGGSRASADARIRTAPSLIKIKTPVDIAVYDVLGKRIATVYSRTRFGGLETFTWDGLTARGHPVPPGVYFLRIHAGEKQEVKKVVVIR